MSSCASTFNWPKHFINVSTNSEVKQIHIDDKPININKGKGKILVQREKKPLELTIETEDSTYHFHLPAKNSFHYVAGGILTLGLNWLIEKNLPKRYFHQENIYLNQQGNKISIHRFPPVPKGGLMLDLTMPYVNTFYVRSSSDYKTENGFIGLSAGLDYFYKENRYISTHVGLATDNEVPFPVGVDYVGNYKIQRVTCIFSGIANNYVIKSLTLGYGINFSKYRWFENDNTGTSLVTNDRNTSAAGISLSGNYRITKNYKLGLLYQPSLVIFENGIKAGYQHLISVQLIWKFKLH